MFLRIFISFASETNNPIGSCQNLRMCSALNALIEEIYPGALWVERYFYQSPEQRYANDSHIKAAENSNYFIFFIDDPYVRSKECIKEYHFFNESKSFPKEYHVFFPRDGMRENLNRLHTLIYVENLSDSDKLTLKNIKKFSDLPKPIKTNFFLPDEEDNNRVAKARTRIKKEIRDCLKIFHKNIINLFKKQHFIGGNFQLKEKEKKELLDLVTKKNLNDKVYFSLSFLNLGPLMPQFNGRFSSDLVYQTTHDPWLLAEATSIYWFIKTSDDYLAAIRTFFSDYNGENNITFITKSDFPERIKEQLEDNIRKKCVFLSVANIADAGIREIANNLESKLADFSDY